MGHHTKYQFKQQLLTCSPVSAWTIIRCIRMIYYGFIIIISIIMGVFPPTALENEISKQSRQEVKIQKIKMKEEK